MKVLPEDKNSEKNDTLLREIKQIKEGVKTREELVAIWFYGKIGIDSNKIKFIPYSNLCL